MGSILLFQTLEGCSKMGIDLTHGSRTAIDMLKLIIFCHSLGCSQFGYSSRLSMQCYLHVYVFPRKTSNVSLTSTLHTITSGHKRFGSLCNTTWDFACMKDCISQAAARPCSSTYDTLGGGGGSLRPALSMKIAWSLENAADG